MGAQCNQKAMFVAGLLWVSLFFAFRESTGRRHVLGVRLHKTGAGEILVLSQRQLTQGSKGSSACNWIAGPVIPLATLFQLAPPTHFSTSQVNLWKVLTWYFRAELEAWSRSHPCDTSAHPVIEPKHRRLSEDYEGPLQVPDRTGTLVVFRERNFDEKHISGVSFTLIDVPLHHSFAQRVARRTEVVVVMIGLDGLFLPYATGSLEAAVVSVLMNHLVPTGRVSRQTVLHGGYS